LKGKSNEFETNAKNKNIGGSHRGLRGFKKRVSSLGVIYPRRRRVICSLIPTKF